MGQKHAPPEEELSPEEQALRMDALVQHGLITAHEASTMEEEEFDAAVGEIFDAKFHQNLYHPEEIGEKKDGQIAEDAVIEQLNQLGLFQAKHASAALDSGPQKADIVLHIEGFHRPIYVQMTMRKDAGVGEKFRRLPETTLPIVVPGTARSVAKRQLPNPENPTWFVKDIMRQLLDEMRRSPVYRPAFNLLWDRFAAKAA